MKRTFKIQFHIVSETGYETTIKFECCHDVAVNDNTLEFTDSYSGFDYKYYLKNIPETQGAKIVDKIKIEECEVEQ